MARWTGDPHITDVLRAADAWRERCVLADGSLFSDERLWTLDNIAELIRRFVANPIEGTDRDFYDKLKEQLSGAKPEVIRLAAEVIWFLLLFPHHTRFGPDKKILQIRTVWNWSGAELPDSPFLHTKCLMGVGNPGTAYLTRRYEQFGFLLEVMQRWKSLPPARRDELMTKDAPWGFVRWLDELPNADRRPVRNAILYFLFPDTLERNVSNEHRRQIVYALRDKIPVDVRPKGRRPNLNECDRAIFSLRKVFEGELDTTEVDFYRPPIYQQWWAGVRDEARRQIGSELTKTLSNYGLELRQCGSKKRTLDDCYPTDTATGFWKIPTDATNKPLRWLLHLEIDGDQVVASLPSQHGDRRIAFANTAQGNSGAVTTRIVPAIKLEEGKYAFYETWEWQLLFCFLPALATGSSGQLFEDFDPLTGKLTYMGKNQDYIAAALITLNEDDDVFGSSDLPRPIRYGEATEALARLINIAPTGVETSRPVRETADAK